MEKTGTKTAPWWALLFTKNRTCWLAWSLLLAAMLVLAALVDWKWDEAWTYRGMAGTTVPEIVSYSRFKLANHHLFNSLWFRWLQSLGATRLFWYRIPSVISFTVLAGASCSIAGLMGIPRWRIVFLLIAPYCVYYFQGRGYAMALAFFALGLLNLLRFALRGEPRHEVGALVFGMISSLTVLSFVFAFLAMLVVHFILAQGVMWRSHRILLWVLSAATVIYAHHVGTIIQTSDPFIIGSENLLGGGMLASIVHDLSWYSKLADAPFYPELKLLAAACLMLPAGYGLLARRRRDTAWEIRTILITVVVLSMLFMVLAHLFAHALYPLGRAISYDLYALLLLGLSWTSAWSRRAVWCTPFIILGSFSGYALGTYFMDLSRPGTEEVLRLSERSPLYALTAGPAVQVVNQVSGLNKPGIVERNTIGGIESAMRSDTAAVKYLYCAAYFRDSLHVDHALTIKCRNKYLLFRMSTHDPGEPH